MKTDSEIERDVTHELEWESRYTNLQVNVDVKNGCVTLSGVVDSYPKKIEAERAAMRVGGIIWVNNNVVVKIADKRSDAEIKMAAINAIKWNTTIDENEIEVKVENGWITLEGIVTWEYQKSKARNLAEDVIGVIGVTNLINVVPSSKKSKKIRRD
jgi:osmotically-inducible protein OsmY